MNLGVIKGSQKEAFTNMPIVILLNFNLSTVIWLYQTHRKQIYPNG